jgi:hypothetical protein
LAHAQQRADDEGATIVWGDEAGCSLLPLVSVATRGAHLGAARTDPRLAGAPHACSSLGDQLSAISASTLEGRLFLQVRTDRDDGEAVVGFLRVVWRKMAGKILLIGDGSPIHPGQAVKDFLRAGAAKRVPLEQWPGYAPDLTPDEGIWTSRKRVELGTGCATTLAELRHRLRHRLRRAAVRVRHKPDVIRACSRQCGYLL